MNVPLYARYDYCNIRACEFLEYYKISTFPIDIFRIIKDSKWALVPYSELMSQFKCDRSTVIRCLGSKDGYTTFDGVNYTISYNDDPLLGNRIRFTLMHEIGHIFLKHLLDFEATILYRGALTKTENKILENEANAFARNVLVPTYLVNQLHSKSTNTISKRFGITSNAAKTRLDLFEIDNSINNNKKLQKRLMAIFINFYYKRKCTICQMSTTLIGGTHCPICGNKSLQWGDGEMKYPKIEAYPNGKIKVCPICNNEETDGEGNFCQICSLFLINECQNVHCESYKKTLPTNARYCAVCGDESLFLHYNILKYWNYRTDGFLHVPDSADNEVFFKIPDGVEDDGLPFN